MFISSLQDEGQDSRPSMKLPTCSAFQLNGHVSPAIAAKHGRSSASETPSLLDSSSPSHSHSGRLATVQHHCVKGRPPSAGYQEQPCHTLCDCDNSFESSEERCEQSAVRPDKGRHVAGSLVISGFPATSASDFSP
ncbi:hypothetical protein SKAU_G00337590 [Synaphobranchus kaupii]|uniref:Uncharacterized protein n=1 Tax=Synaphobranchus kaupii TaxID=118154 RepID=A0A9Q1EME0_SYNKA|nr:hypothetical protein SKAU_G00337590 [Synaphobranchus kaupii]